MSVLQAKAIPGAVKRLCVDRMTVPVLRQSKNFEVVGTEEQYEKHTNSIAFPAPAALELDNNPFHHICAFWIHLTLQNSTLFFKMFLKIFSSSLSMLQAFFYNFKTHDGIIKHMQPHVGRGSGREFKTRSFEKEVLSSISNTFTHELYWKEGPELLKNQVKNTLSSDLLPKLL